jgi:hypothetical protein
LGSESVSRHGEGSDHSQILPIGRRQDRAQKAFETSTKTRDQRPGRGEKLITHLTIVVDNAGPIGHSLSLTASTRSNPGGEKDTRTRFLCKISIALRLMLYRIPGGSVDS